MVGRICYALTTIGELWTYNENTVVFSAGDRQLVLHDSKALAEQQMPAKWNKDIKKNPVVMKFELPYRGDPNVLSLDLLTQVGYPHYGKAKQGTKMKSQAKQALDHGELMHRLSVVHLTDVKEDIGEKERMLREISDYVDRVEQYTESETEWVDALGMPARGFQELTGLEYSRVMGVEPNLGFDPTDTGTFKPKVDNQERLIKDYGLTPDEYDIFLRLRPAVTRLGIKWSTNAMQGYASMRLSPLAFPHLDQLEQVAGMVFRVTGLAELMASGKVEILVPLLERKSLYARPRSMEEQGRLMMDIANSPELFDQVVQAINQVQRERLDKER